MRPYALGTIEGPVDRATGEAGVWGPDAAVTAPYAARLLDVRSVLRKCGVRERYVAAESRASEVCRHAESDASALTSSQREVLVLRYYLDLSESDIASALGVSRGAVKSHASRGLATLRARVAIEEGQP